MTIDTSKKNNGRPNEFLNWATNSSALRVKPAGAKNEVGFIIDSKGEKPTVGNFNWAVGVASDWASYAGRNLRQIKQTGVQDGLNIHFDLISGTNAIFSLYKASQAISFVYHGAGSEGVIISRTGQDDIQAGDLVVINGSTDNDGTYREIGRAHV